VGSRTSARDDNSLVDELGRLNDHVDSDQMKSPRGWPSRAAVQRLPLIGGGAAFFSP
jgi:hypothetical protein